eukprot:412869_1
MASQYDESKHETFSVYDQKVISTIIANVNEKDITKDKPKIDGTTVLQFLKSKDMTFQSLANNGKFAFIALLQPICTEKKIKPSLIKLYKYIQATKPFITLLLPILKITHSIETQKHNCIIIVYAITNKMDIQQFRKQKHKFVSQIMNEYNLKMSAEKHLKNIWCQLITSIVNSNQKLAEFMSVIAPIIDRINTEMTDEKDEYQQISKQNVTIFVGCENMTVSTFRTLNKENFKKLIGKDYNIQQSVSDTLFSRIRAKTLYYGALVYSFGVKYWYSRWDNNFNQDAANLFVKPRYDNLKKEYVESIVSSTSNKPLTAWKKLLNSAEKNLTKEKCRKQCRPTNKKIKQYRIECGAPILKEHLMAVQLYCNYDKEQAEFSKTYWKINRVFNANDTDEKSQENDDLIKRHSLYANWGRLLYEAVNVYGTDSAYFKPATDTSLQSDCQQKISIMKFWHGVDKEMLFPSVTSIKIYGPVSTSRNKDYILRTFTQGGLAIELDGYRNCSFNCEWLSDYKDEKEHLFIGGRYPFNICDIKLNRCFAISLKKYVKALNNIVSDDLGLTADDMDIYKENCIEKFCERLRDIKDMNKSSIELEQYVVEIGKSLLAADVSRKFVALDYIAKLYHYYFIHKEHIKTRHKLGNMNHFDLSNKVEHIVGKIIQHYSSNQISEEIVKCNVFKQLGIENKYQFTDLQQRVIPIIVKHFEEFLKTGYNCYMQSLNINNEDTEQNQCDLRGHAYKATPTCLQIFCTKCGRVIVVHKNE